MTSFFIYNIADHYWDFGESYFSDNYGNIDGLQTGNFVASGFGTSGYHAHLKMLKSESVSRDKCLLNPDNCKEGFSLSMSSKSLYFLSCYTDYYFY